MQIPVAVMVIFFVLLGQRPTRYLVIAVVTSLLGGGAVFCGGFLDGNLTDYTGIFLWTVVLVMTASQYIVTKKLVSLYNYPTATAW